MAHRVDAPGPVALRTVYFGPEAPPAAAASCVFAVDALARELILLAMRFRPEGPPDPLAGPVFATLEGLCREWVQRPLPWRLPRAQSPELARAMAYAEAHLDAEVGQAAVARAAGLSPRTLARRFAAEAGMPWRRYLHTARMLRAMELLQVPGARVGEVAVAVGFTSFGAFSQAFRAFTGEAPSRFRAA
ncbi:MAG: AraC family transcriptional regulator [bacterium]